MILRTSEEAFNARGEKIGTKPGLRIRFNAGGRYATSDPELVAAIQAHLAFGHPDARSRVEIYDPARSIRELRDAADRLENSL